MYLIKIHQQIFVYFLTKTGTNKNNNNKQLQPKGAVALPQIQQISGSDMEVDDPIEYAFYCSDEYDPMELD